LVAGNRIVGVIQLLNGLGQSEFTEQDQRILSTIADFTAIAIENSRLLQTVRALTITDDLTGLYNSRHFQTLCDYEMERATRYGSELSMVFLDLDHFKQVNDTYGHLTGSRVLKEVGQLIREVIRKVDHAARYGGDEFIFLLPSTGKQGALGMARNLLEVLRDREFISDCGQSIKVTASIGVATYPTNAYCLQELIKLSDEVMYEVKRSTRNAVKSA
jgi:diguanylate cyclase (GGDEF)-like protein